jgi:hypothetical protein
MVRTKLLIALLLLFGLGTGLNSPVFAASNSTHLGISQHNQLKTLVNARPQAQRSVTITLSNRSGETLYRSDWALDHGIWTTLPPETIPNHTQVTWESESNGFMTGTEGHITYSIGTTGEWAYMHWDNPFFGSNSYDQRVSGGGYEIDPSGRGDGNNSSIKYVVS